MTGSLLYKRWNILHNIAVWQNHGRQNGIITRMLFAECAKSKWLQLFSCVLMGALAHPGCASAHVSRVRVSLPVHVGNTKPRCQGNRCRLVVQVHVSTRDRHRHDLGAHIRSAAARSQVLVRQERRDHAGKAVVVHGNRLPAARHCSGNHVLAPGSVGSSSRQAQLAFTRFSLCVVHVF